jgi:GT2 family glycosyltransferase
VPGAAERVWRNDWRRVVPAGLGQLEARLTVTVVIPARDCQFELGLTLAALAEQTYPSELVDVIVVDDASSPPLSLPVIRPRRSRLLRLGEYGAHGSGRARAEGAKAAEGDVLLFLDADMIAEREHVEAHLRWHHVLADAVVLGSKEFVDVSGLDAAGIGTAVRDGSLGELLAGRERSDHGWLDRLIERTHGLVEAGDELFTAVVGATLSVPRGIYHESGGFSSFDRRGIVDTEFGYRAVTAGAIVVPDPEARSVHQGLRSFVTQGEGIKRLRAGLAANYLPTRIFRPPVRGRSWAVPRVAALVPADGLSYEQLAVTVDAIVAGDLDDVAVTVHGRLDEQCVELLCAYYSHDRRVSISPGQGVDTGFPSPYTAIVPAGTVLGTTALTALVRRLDDSRLGLVTTETAAGEVQVWRTAALHRARRDAPAEGDDAVAAVARLFGAERVSRGLIPATEAKPRANRTGMVYDETLAALVDPARPRFRQLRRWMRRGGRGVRRVGSALRSTGPRTRA